MSFFLISLVDSDDVVSQLNEDESLMFLCSKRIGTLLVDNSSAVELSHEDRRELDSLPEPSRIFLVNLFAKVSKGPFGEFVGVPYETDDRRLFEDRSGVLLLSSM